MGSSFLDAQHLLNHLIVLCHRMPSHLGPLGDGAVIRLVGAEPHVLPDLPLLLGKFLRRWDPSQPIQDGLPLGVQLLDEHLQLQYNHCQVLGQDDLEKRIISSSFLNCQDAASKGTIAPTRIQKQQHYADGFQYNKRSSSCASFITVRFYIAGHTVRKLKESDTVLKSVCTSIEIPNPCQYACQTEIDLARHIIRHSFFPPPFHIHFSPEIVRIYHFFLNFFTEPDKIIKTLLVLNICQGRWMKRKALCQLAECFYFNSSGGENLWPSVIKSSGNY